MPELPEVETVCRTIAPHVVGREIAAVAVHDTRLRRPIAPDFVGRSVQTRKSDRVQVHLRSAGADVEREGIEIQRRPEQP